MTTNQPKPVNRRDQAAVGPWHFPRKVALCCGRAELGDVVLVAGEFRDAVK
jgi:hypothetical protein